jgi:hypothetical protein
MFVVVDALSENAISTILQARTKIRGPLGWSRRGGHTRLRKAVDHERGENLILDMHISEALPWKYTVQLMWNRRPIRRLDVRGSHRNTCDGSGQVWSQETHKHAYSDAYDLARAYTPDDIPKTEGRVIGTGEYKSVFEAFLEECQIENEATWEEPRLTGLRPTLGSVK